MSAQTLFHHILHPVVFTFLLFIISIAFTSIIVYLARIDTRTPTQKAIDRLQWFAELCNEVQHPTSHIASHSASPSASLMPIYPVAYDRNTTLVSKEDYWLERDRATGLSPNVTDGEDDLELDRRGR